jgi:xylulokinase
VTPHVLSIDLGTGGPKAALVAADGSIAAAASRPVATQRIAPDGAEQDPEEIWRAIVACTREVVRRSGLGRRDVVGVTVASQFSSVVPVDSDVRPTMNMLLWMDSRGAPHGRAIYERSPEAGGRWIELHGALPLPSGNDTLAHMLWVQHERPEVYERTRWFVEAMDFVTGRLTGTCTANPCTAFMMLLTDNRKLGAVAYSDELIGLAGLDRDKLPELVRTTSCVGNVRADVAEELGLSPETRVFSGLNDTQAIAVGAGAFDGRGGINVGTTSQVLAHVDGKDTDIENNLVSAPSALPGSYVVIAENGLGAKALDHFLRNVFFAADALADHATERPFATVEAALGKTPPGSDGLLFLPWLTGAAAPSADPHARGGFLNLTLDTTREHMVRAICEGVALNLRWLLPAVERFSRREFDELRFSGGGALSDTWSQILADVTERPVLQLRDARYASNRATALLVFEELGEGKIDDLNALCPVRRTYEPRRAASAVYASHFEQFLAAFERNRPIFAALNA